MFRAIGFALILAASPAFAVELHLATNQQILDELSRRLNPSGPSEQFAASSTCDYADLEVTIYDDQFQVLSKLDAYYHSSAKCQEMINALPFGARGHVRVGDQFAYCDHADLEVYGVKPDGRLRLLSDTYAGSVTTCHTQMREFNRR